MLQRPVAVVQRYAGLEHFSCCNFFLVSWMLRTSTMSKAILEVVPSQAFATLFTDSWLGRKEGAGLQYVFGLKDLVTRPGVGHGDELLGPWAQPEHLHRCVTQGQ